MEWDGGGGGGSAAKPSYLYGDDVAGTVDHRQALIHEQLPHVFHVPLVGPAQRLPLGALQDPDRLQGSSQHHRGQGSGEDEAGCEGAHSVHQGGAAGDVASNTAKGFAWNINRWQRVCEVRTQEIIRVTNATYLTWVFPLYITLLFLFYTVTEDTF